MDIENVFIPAEKSYEFNTYHTFVIQVDKRNELKKYLKKNLSTTKSTNQNTKKVLKTK